MEDRGARGTGVDWPRECWKEQLERVAERTEVGDGRRLTSGRIGVLVIFPGPGRGPPGIGGTGLAKRSFQGCSDPRVRSCLLGDGAQQCPKAEGVADPDA
ncbi:hypothetical protein NDU88_001793 [Pleurodeles waltl]|uniref:Uncharacterized protein n=1 Tax=Pleurodeles waltl TaxID=8319 RepID=A0AAV7VCX6_PLEWA|nr:hypothetical protein NDU88_001793 [Pleurodeles waltl]